MAKLPVISVKLWMVSARTAVLPDNKAIPPFAQKRTILRNIEDSATLFPSSSISFLVIFSCHRVLLSGSAGRCLTGRFAAAACLGLSAMGPHSTCRIGILHNKTAATGDDPPHFTSAFRAFVDRRVIHRLAYFKAPAAGAAKIFIDQHVILSSSPHTHSGAVL